MTTHADTVSLQHSGIPAALAQRVAVGADAAQIAYALIGSLRQMAALSPIIDKGHVAAGHYGPSMERSRQRFCVVQKQVG